MKAVELLQADIKQMQQQITLREQGIAQATEGIQKAQAEIEQLGQSITERKAAIAELTAEPTAAPTE